MNWRSVSILRRFRISNTFHCEKGVHLKGVSRLFRLKKPQTSSKKQTQKIPQTLKRDDVDHLRTIVQQVL